MRLTLLKQCFYLMLMVGLMAIVFVAKNVIISHLLASLGIITGAYLCNNLSNKNEPTNEKS